MTISMMSAHIAPADDWTGRLRQIALGLFAILPAMLLFSRGGAEIVVGLINVGYLAVLLVRREWRSALFPPLLTLLATWLALNLLVSPFAVDPAASFGRSTSWLRFILLFAAVTTWLIQSPRDVKFVAMAWAAIIGFAILDGLLQLLRGVSLTGQPITGSGRLTGPLDRPNIGMFVARIGFPLLAVGALLLARGSRVSVLRACAILALAATAFGFILLTGERAASLLTLIAIATSAGLAILLAPPPYRLYGLLLLVATAGVLAAIVLNSPRIMSRVAGLLNVLNNFWDSPYGELFAAGLHVWREFPLTGAGMKNFQIACQIVLGDTLKDGCHPHPHNAYIEWLAETGIIGSLGFLTFLATLGALCIDLLRRTPTRIVGALVTGSLMLLLFPFTASQSFFSNWPAMLLWTSLSLVIATARLAARPDAKFAG
ncbi:MAG: O-antigen ligase family protein [Ferrovibrio sp.]|uniref:O-antigen ligase family protein n=1 Tax=Ferrovibrio sp. TaxID=1917215 RepID=UPI00391D4121